MKLLLSRDSTQAAYCPKIRTRVMLWNSGGSVQVRLAVAKTCLLQNDVEGSLPE